MMEITQVQDKLRNFRNAIASMKQMDYLARVNNSDLAEYIESGELAGEIKVPAHESMNILALGEVPVVADTEVPPGEVWGYSREDEIKAVVKFVNPKHSKETL